MKIVMANVGHGLCMLMESEKQYIQIDCGAGNNSFSKKACESFFRNIYYFEWADKFILSHFHSDHYNGLLYLCKNKNRRFFYNLKDIYFPGIPKIVRDNEDLGSKIFLYLLSINNRILGNSSGSMEYDFLEVMKCLNNTSFNYKPLFQGDIIEGTNIKVIWPPKKMFMNEEISNKIVKAIEKFEEALEEDKKLAEIYERIMKNEKFFDYFHKEGIFKSKYRLEEEKILKRKKEELPEITKEANTLLRKVANYFSIGFYEGNKVLFMGDAEGYNIRHMVEYLKKENMDYFKYFIAPHHGTHWDDSLIDIIWDNLLVSKSGKYSLRKEYIRYSSNLFSKIFITEYFGDIILPEIYKCFGISGIMAEC
ncbi:hypothetical protein SAMN02745164_02043 [Marinitoga hydrogenitolerans DSM 16785]|uniref:Metallo-beta-lactamase domain-containing protein n=1 Tax=Marinitoga hydrogenitolerans (strain DSM 16785 / JCM 12826 / AT1271) TaxID=1122195 RepID=A0A1M4ZXH6_MARH1|nr:hypothetical protein [Marinitoga hydrogenitolerans]SHF22674.1 hypothetical protein SAMN02745164_02043 [Marinitoga hydrogenitolerans DSM 16785]